MAQGSRAGGAPACPVPASPVPVTPGDVLPLPQLLLKLGTVAVPVHQREAAVAVAGRDQDPGVAGMPSAGRQHVPGAQARVPGPPAPAPAAPRQTRP